MNRFTIGDRILLHLSRYELLDESKFNVTWDITQDGIAASLRISRAHSSIALKKLRTDGMVAEYQGHIKGGKIKKKSYYLTPAGMDYAKRLRESAEKEGIDIMPMLDMKRCDPQKLWDSVNDADRDVLGIACVIRRSVPRAGLPDTAGPVIPADSNGMTVLSDIVKRNVLSVADNEKIRDWHSAAADYWLDRDDIKERLYHLVCAGRTRDACRLIVNERDTLLYDISGLAGILPGPEDIPERYIADVMPVKITAAMQADDLISSETMIGILTEHDKEMGLLYSAALEMKKGDRSKALSLISSVGRTGRFDVDIGVAGALGRLGKTKEAIDLLMYMKEELIRSGTVGGLDRIYIQMADVSVASDDNDSSINYLTKALGVTTDTGRKRVYSLLAASYNAVGMSKKAGECLARSR